MRVWSLDTYAGYKNSFAEDFSYDVGFIRYNYPGTYTPPATYAKADTSEVYGAIGYKWIFAKYSYALGQFLTVPGASGTSYLEVNASYPVNDTGITLGAHYGKQTYKAALPTTSPLPATRLLTPTTSWASAKTLAGMCLDWHTAIPMRAKAAITPIPVLLG